MKETKGRNWGTSTPLPPAILFCFRKGFHEPDTCLQRISFIRSMIQCYSQQSNFLIFMVRLNQIDISNHSHFRYLVTVLKSESCTYIALVAREIEIVVDKLECICMTHKVSVVYYWNVLHPPCGGLLGLLTRRAAIKPLQVFRLHYPLQLTCLRARRRNSK